MPRPIRIATFNAENLFDRASIMMLDWDKGAEKFALVSQLQNELQKPVYDKRKIADIRKKLKDYAEIVEARGKIKYAKGPEDFNGWVELKRTNIKNPAQRNTAKTIAELNADIVCLAEIESRPVLQRFHDKILAHFLEKDKRYPCIMLIDGNDFRRGIDVALMSRYQIEDVDTHIWDSGPDGKPVFSRDCLEVKIALPGGKKLTALVNHFKSKGYGHPAENDAKRKAQAERVAEILASKYDLSKDLVVVAGDLNDTPDSKPLKPLVSVSNLYNAINALPSNQRWTYRYKKKGNQLDYLIVSRPLKNALRKVHIERGGMYGVPPNTPGYVKPFPTVKDEASSASDHAAVVAEFMI